MVRRRCSFCELGDEGCCEVEGVEMEVERGGRGGGGEEMREWRWPSGRFSKEQRLQWIEEG